MEPGYENLLRLQACINGNSHCGQVSREEMRTHTTQMVEEGETAGSEAKVPI